MGIDPNQEDQSREKISGNKKNNTPQYHEDISPLADQNLQYVHNEAKSIAENYNKNPCHRTNLSAIILENFITLHQLVLDVEGNMWKKIDTKVPHEPQHYWYRKNSRELMALEEYARATFYANLDFLSKGDKSICTVMAMHFREKYITYKQDTLLPNNGHTTSIDLDELLIDGSQVRNFIEQLKIKYQ